MGKGGDIVDASHRGSPSFEVVKAVSEAEGVETTELCPPEYPALHEVIDPQSLDTLFELSHNGSEQGVSVSFTYCGYQVTVRGDGSVELQQ